VAVTDLRVASFSSLAARISLDPDRCLVYMSSNFIAIVAKISKLAVTLED
jgi:hypothetical protein